MTIQEQIVAKLQVLPAEKQQAVLELVESLSHPQGAAARESRTRVRGLWEDLQVDVSAEDIEEARQEMWGKYRD
jgi:hypothetical protein